MDLYSLVYTILLLIFIVFKSVILIRVKMIWNAIIGKATIVQQNVVIDKDSVISDQVVDIKEGVQMNFNQLNGKTFIIFGKARIGKSSLINVLCGAKVTKTSPGVAGCTFSFSKYRINGVTFYDTIGLNEEADGNFDPKKSAKELMVLINTINEIHGLIVVHNGVPDKLFRDNIQLVHEGMLEKKVPLIIFINKAEESISLDHYNELLKTQFKSFNLGQSVVIGGCTSMSENPVIYSRLKEIRTMTRELLINTLINTALDVPFLFTNKENTIIKIRNVVRGWLKLKRLIYDKIGSLASMLGLTESDEDEIRERVTAMNASEDVKM
jgi:GTP-binding protein EngB required for normal cell division